MLLGLNQAVEEMNIAGWLTVNYTDSKEFTTEKKSLTHSCRKKKLNNQKNNRTIKMGQFRLPRKTKKSLKKTMWLYPPDEKGNSVMAWPAKSQEDYTAIKKGTARKFPSSTKAERKKFRDELDKEIFVSDQVLKTYVDDIIREDLRNSSYNTLVEAKTKPKAVKAYFNFVNAYQLFEKGEESYGNICCMAIDSAKELLKPQKKK